MKKLAVLMAGIVGLGIVLAAIAGDAVEPAAIEFVCLREESQGFASDVYFFENSTVRCTNCVLYSGTTTNSAVQGLDAVTIDVDVGNTSTNINYSGMAMVASNGTWWCDIEVPEDIPTCYLQIKITDENTNSYIYPWKMIKTKASL